MRVHPSTPKIQAWQDWRACLFPAKGKDGVPTYAELAKTFPPKHDTAFHNMLQAAKRGSLPWEAAPINGAGVLIVPGKPEGRVLWRGLQNGMDNLPAAWPIYVSGGATALKTVKELFPVEVEVGKITLDDLGDDELNEVGFCLLCIYPLDPSIWISLLIPNPTTGPTTAGQDPRPADQGHGLLRQAPWGDLALLQCTSRGRWSIPDKSLGRSGLKLNSCINLTRHQVDGALCAPQRDLLEYFIQKDFGWWGPSWRHGWDVMPRFGGGDVFTLRQKRFVYEVINKSVKQKRRIGADPDRFS